MDMKSANIKGKDKLKEIKSQDWDSRISSTTDIKMPDMDLDAKEIKPSLARPKSDGPTPKRAAKAIPLDGFKWNMQALATAADAVESGGKSPVSALNELGVRVNYTLRQQGGPPHCPSFVITVEVSTSLLIYILFICILAINNCQNFYNIYLLVFARDFA
ncbi:PREDICTED: uncharacterized protein LOC106101256, partial [Papilio polytes]|uniref:uncharacterized protein LOC106101256 n=1 Tax=Papilio polytes TaxID=76194 RepID=UPI000675CC94